MNDEKLIEDCINGVRSAQYELYKKYYPILMPVCLRYHSNQSDAASILNTGFLKIFSKLDKFNLDGRSFLPWAKRIVINTLIDDYRKNKKQKELIEYQDQATIKEVYTGAFLSDSHLDLDEETLQNMLNQLPNQTKQVFCLFAIDDYSHKEISELLTMSVGTSKWHVSNARKKLMAMISKRSASSKVI